MTGNEERLIKVTLKGIMGPLQIGEEKYPGHVPMTPFGGILKDDEIAAVLTYVRNSFGNEASPITADQVKAVRAATEGQTVFYKAEDLLKEHPMETKIQ